MMVELNERELATCISGIIGLLARSGEMDTPEQNRIIELHNKLGAALDEELNHGD
jgi:hypothetical protein